MAQKKLRSAIWFFHDDYAGEELLYSKCACIICSMLCISHKNVGQCSVCIILYTWGGGQDIGGWFWSASTTPPRSKQVWHCLVVRPGPILRNILQYTLLGSNQGCSIEHNQQTKFSQLKHESTFSVSDRLLLGEGDYWTTLHEAAMIETVKTVW